MARDVENDDDAADAVEEKVYEQASKERGKNGGGSVRAAGSARPGRRASLLGKQPRSDDANDHESERRAKISLSAD